jgi:hypothetical protein
MQRVSSAGFAAEVPDESAILVGFELTSPP